MLGRFDQLDLLAAFGNLAFARGDHLFLGSDSGGPRHIRLGPRLALLAAFVLHSDLLFLPGDFERLHLRDTRLFHRTIRLDLLRIDQLLGLDLGRIRFPAAFSLFARNLGALLGAAHFHFAFLFQPREFLIAADLETLLVGFEVFHLDLHAGILLDIVAQFLARFDLLGQLGQALGVEGVVGVEMFDAGLVQPGQ